VASKPAVTSGLTFVLIHCDCPELCVTVLKVCSIGAHGGRLTDVTTTDPVLKQLVADANAAEGSIPLDLYLPSDRLIGHTKRTTTPAAGRRISSCGSLDFPAPLPRHRTPNMCT
jgi:hypothetical protein